MRLESLVAANLTLEQETAAFERLKPRLAELWARVFPNDDEPYTVVVVPSLTTEPGELARHAGALFLEETLLFFLIRLRNPRARVIYVTSQPIPGAIMDYLLQFLAGIPASHAAARLTLLSAHDATLRPLTEKILERPRLMRRIREAIRDPSRAYLTVFRSTPLERRLAVLLDIPLNAADPRMEALCTKSGARRILREAGVATPLGFEDIGTEDELLHALAALRRERPGLRRALLKRNTGYMDAGHALLRFPAQGSREALRRALRKLAFSVPAERSDSYLLRFAETGGVVEEFIEGPALTTASGQVRISPLGEVTLTSTHDELRAGPAGLSAVGCLFPASEPYRLRIQEASLGVGRALAAKGLVSRLSVEFLVWRHPADGEARLAASEINLGFGGTTHPLLAVRFLAGGRLDPASGLFHSPSGRPKFYRATDHLQSDAYRGLVPDDLIEILTLNQLHYSHRTESGALFYMLGAVSELGRLGMLAIGNSRKEAEAVFCRTVEALDADVSR